MPVSVTLNFMAVVVIGIQLLIFVYLYRSNRVRFFRYLVWAWGSYVASKAFEAVRYFAPTPGLGGASIGFGLLGDSLILAAALAFRGNYAIRPLHALAVVAYALYAASYGPLVRLGYGAHAPGGLSGGLALLASAVAFWPRRQASATSTGQRFLAVSLALWGLHRLVTPLVISSSDRAFVAVNVSFVLIYYLVVFAIVIVVLDRARSEVAALKEFNERLIDGLGEGLQLVDETFTVRHVNRWLTEQLGVTPGARCYEALTADGRECPGCPLIRSVRSDTGVGGLFQMGGAAPAADLHVGLARMGGAAPASNLHRGGLAQPAVAAAAPDHHVGGPSQMAVTAAPANLRVGGPSQAAGAAAPVNLHVVGPGQRRYELTCSPVRQPDGQVFLLELVADVTEQERMRSRLTEAERLASVGELAAGMAHEIRNPLAAIVNATALLESEESLRADERAATIGAVRKEARRLNGILSDFLRFARPVEPKRVESDIRDVVGHVAALVGEQQARAPELAVETRVDDDVPRFAFDPDQLTQVLWNVSQNAIEAMKGRGRLLIHGRREGPEAVIEVADSGPGISPEDLRRIFEPFYSRRAGGTGLGLPIARRIVASHGGRIEVNSVAGEGTRVLIRLPIG